MMKQQSENATVWNVDDEYGALENGTQFEHSLDDGYVRYSQRPETYIVPVLLALIFLVGSLGNGTLILIFARHRTVRNVPNIYILNLAIGDLLVIVMCVPFTSLMYSVESWPLGELICKLVEASKDVSIGVSVFTLSALSAERYSAVVQPIRRHVRNPLTIVTTIWVFSLLLTLPAAIFSKVYSVKMNSNEMIEYCTPFPYEFGSLYAKTIVLYKFFAYWVVPLCIIGGFYVLLARHLVFAARNMPGEQQGQSNHVQARKKVAKIVLVFIILFIVCFLPYNIVMLSPYFALDFVIEFENIWSVFRIVSFCLTFIHSCINPIALYCMSKEFRKHFNRYLFCCIKQSSR
ncbi:neuropeptide CCHamide-2 receptor-like [Lycorma delicatula]|uniref:neuropeptide CCHamide-2 receptor-like n=1 Tax=Lycorma delicatula TaxID=130591 RepID=UPI003F50F668